MKIKFNNEKNIRSFYVTAKNKDIDDDFIENLDKKDLILLNKKMFESEDFKF